MPAGLLGIEELDRAEIAAILARAKDFQPMQSQSLKKLDTLRGKMIGQSVLEASTRTRTSFEIAPSDWGGRGCPITGVGIQRSQGRLAGGNAGIRWGRCGRTPSVMPPTRPPARRIF